MVDPSLPPGTTHADIDHHFGEPEKRTVHGDVRLAVSVETQFFDSEREMVEELMDAVETVVTDAEGDCKGNIVQVLDAEVGEVE